jgi:hypothetical protein
MLTYHSAKQMYNPQTYHHIQVIQKYNIQDYRPRYVFSCQKDLANTDRSNLAWNNSKKPSEKSAKYSACANNAATPSHKPMNLRRESSRLMTRQEKEAGMVRWPVRDRRRGGEVGLYWRHAFRTGIGGRCCWFTAVLKGHLYCFNEKIIIFSCSIAMSPSFPQRAGCARFFPRQSKLTYIISTDSLPSFNPPFTIMPPNQLEMAPR